MPKSAKKTGGAMSVRDAGRKGGEKTAETHGHDFYEAIGHKGGACTAKTHGHAFYEDIGHKGGAIGGPKGGQKVRELIHEGKKAQGAS
jgi:general stress protein YciG